MTDQPVGHSKRSSSCTSVGIIMVHFMSNQLMLLTNSINKLFLACFFKIDYSSVVHCTFYLSFDQFLFIIERYQIPFNEVSLKYNLYVQCTVRKILTHIFTITKSELLYGTLKK